MHLPARDRGQPPADPPSFTTVACIVARPTHPDEPRQKAASVANTAKATNTNGATNEKT